LAAQRTYNKTVKGEGRKKFREAIDRAAPTPDVAQYYEQERLASFVDASIAMLPPSE
jgi:hypothetical protein